MKDFTNNGKLYTARRAGPSEEQVVAAKALLIAHNESVAQSMRDSRIQCECGEYHIVGETVYHATHFTMDNNTLEGEGFIVCSGCLRRIILSFDCVETQSSQWKRQFKGIVEEPTD